MRGPYGDYRRTRVRTGDRPSAPSWLDVSALAGLLGRNLGGIVVLVIPPADQDLFRKAAPLTIDLENRMSEVKTLKVVYGADCMWWDTIDKVAINKSDPPCCPHCGSALFEVESIEKWWEGADAYEKANQPGYRKFLEWSRGKCFKTFDEGWAAYSSDDRMTGDDHERPRRSRPPPR
jgi:hypothetical protein